MFDSTGEFYRDIKFESPDMAWGYDCMDWKPDIDLAVYLVENKDDGMGDCLAGALISLPLENHQNLTVKMEKGRCPIRK